MKLPLCGKNLLLRFTLLNIFPDKDKQSPEMLSGDGTHDRKLMNFFGEMRRSLFEVMAM